MPVLLAFAEGSIQLVPDGTLLFHFVVIVLMVALLNATLLRPINRILEERDRRTRGRFTEAQETLALVDARIREYERRLREARAEGYALMERQRQELFRKKEVKVGEVKAEITGWLSSQKEQLRDEAEQVRGKLKADARTTALEISRQILRREITDRSRQ